MLGAKNTKVEAVTIFFDIPDSDMLDLLFTTTRLHQIHWLAAYSKLTAM